MFRPAHLARPARPARVARPAQLAGPAAAVIAAGLVVTLVAGCASSTSGTGSARPAGRSGEPARSGSAAAGSAGSGARTRAEATSRPPSGSAGCTYQPTGAAAREVTPPPATPRRYRTLTLSLRIGADRRAATVVVALTPQTAPCTVNSVGHLAGAGFYDATSCHRLTTAGIFVLQCGDPTGTGSGGPGYRFADELSGSETYPAGTLAMANAGPGTNGSQFFIVYRDTQLPPSYTVFGAVGSGLDAITAVAAAGTDDANGAGDGHPRSAVQITHAAAG